MKNMQQNQKSPHFLLNLSMIALETFYSFVFNHDDVVTKHAEPFISKNMVVKVNLYIPYVDFYVRFTPNGLLFDLEKPTESHQLEISSTLFGYMQALLLGNKRSLRSIKIYGDKNDKDQFRDFLTQIALPHLVSDWHKWLIRPTKDDVIASKNRIAPLLEKIDFQRSKINTLQVEVKQYRNRIKNIQRKQRFLNIGFCFIIFVLICIVAYMSWIK